MILLDIATQSDIIFVLKTLRTYICPWIYISSIATWSNYVFKIIFNTEVNENINVDLTLKDNWLNKQKERKNRKFVEKKRNSSQNVSLLKLGSGLNVGVFNSWDMIKSSF